MSFGLGLLAVAGITAWIVGACYVACYMVEGLGWAGRWTIQERWAGAVFCPILGPMAAAYWIGWALIYLAGGLRLLFRRAFPVRVDAIPRARALRIGK